jgi:hypothetical protein
MIRLLAVISDGWNLHLQKGGFVPLLSLWTASAPGCVAAKMKKNGMKHQPGQPVEEHTP